MEEQEQDIISRILGLVALRSLLHRVLSIHKRISVGLWQIYNKQSATVLTTIVKISVILTTIVKISVNIYKYIYPSQWPNNNLAKRLYLKGKHDTMKVAINVTKGRGRQSYG